MSNNVTLYDISVGQFIAGLTVLRNLLHKAQAHADAATLPSARLIEDMKPLNFHVQCVVQTVDRGLSRVTETEIKNVQHDETTMQEIIALTEKTLAMVQGIKPELLEGKDAVLVKLPAGTFSAKQFLLGFVVPNFYFHLQTVYSILRMSGVELGKQDYMNPFNAAYKSD